MVCKTMYTGSTPVVASNSIRALSSGGEYFLDAEGVRGSNPLAPTGQRLRITKIGVLGFFRGCTLSAAWRERSPLILFKESQGDSP